MGNFVFFPIWAAWSCTGIAKSQGYLTLLRYYKTHRGASPIIYIEALAYTSLRLELGANDIIGTFAETTWGECPTG